MQVYDLNLVENTHWREMFEEYRTTVILNSDIRSENYTQQRFNIDKQLGTFLMFDEIREKIAGVCAVYIPPHWPKTIARLYNRSFVDPYYRIKGLSRSNEHSNLGKTRTLGKLCHQFAYQHMIDVCIKNDVKLGVATRENSGKSNSINTMYRCGIDKDPRWKIDERYFLTMPAPNEFTCWQRLIYLPLNDDIDPNFYLDQIPNISREEFETKFYDN